jgi:hypothetical protein
MKHGFAVLKMEAANLERGDIRVYGFRTAYKLQQNIRCYIVAERNRQSQKFAQGYIDHGIRILILERTVDVRQDAVLRQEPHWLIQRERALLDLMQNRESERQLEN